MRKGVEKIIKSSHGEQASCVRGLLLLSSSQIFWLIPPTRPNLIRFETWSKGAMQSSVFFGDLCSDCSFCVLEVCVHAWIILLS